MSYSEDIAAKIREALMGEKVEEKKMFGGIAFMVNGKMCATASPQSNGHLMMVRVAPTLHEKLIQRKGASTAIMRGKEYKGWIFLAEEAIQSEKDFKDWIDLSLAFNKKTVKLRDK